MIYTIPKEVPCHSKFLEIYTALSNSKPGDTFGINAKKSETLNIRAVLHKYAKAHGFKLFTQHNPVTEVMEVWVVK